MAMTLEIIELLDELASASAMIGYATSGAERNNHKAARDKIKAEIIAHLTQPAQPCPYVVGSDEGTHYCRLNGPPQPAQEVDAWMTDDGRVISAVSHAEAADHV